MASRTLHRDVSEIPVLVEPKTAPVTDAAAQPLVPRPSEAPSVEAGPEPDPEAGPESGGGQPLSERERAVLTFEKQHWKHSGAKEQAIRDLFELSANRYYQVLNALLDRPEAQQFEPALINRLRRVRATKQRARSGRTQPRTA